MESHFCTVSQIFLAIPIMNPLARVHDYQVLYSCIILMIHILIKIVYGKYDGS